MAVTSGGNPPSPCPRRQYHFPPRIISLIYEHYRARYPGDRRCSSRFASVSRAWAHEVEKCTFRRLIVDVSTVTTTDLDNYQNYLYMGMYHSPSGGDDLTKLENYVRGPRRAILRELVFVLPDPMRHVDACNASIRRLLDVLGGWGLPAPMQRAYVDLEVFITDEYADLYNSNNNSRPLSRVFRFEAGGGGRGHQPAFNLANTGHIRSLRPGPLPFSMVFVVKRFVFGRGRRYVKVDAWRAQMCPYLADSLLGVNNSTFVLGDNSALLPVNDWLHGWFARIGIDSKSRE